MMFTFQIIMMAVRGLRANLMRSLLATLGVIIGVAAVISAMSILEGAQRDIVERVESLGSDTISVFPGEVRIGGRVAGLARTLTVADADWLSDPRKCPSIALAAPQVSASYSIKYFNRNEDVSVLGTNEQYGPMYSYKPIQGRFLSRDDVRSEQKVVVLGYKVAKELFGNRPPINVPVKIKGIPFRVIGVMEKKGNIGFRTVDKQVIIPVTTAMNRLLGIRHVHSISVKAADTEQVDQATKEIKRELRRRHDVRIRHGQKDDFYVYSQEQQRNEFQQVTKIFQIVLYSIAGISLVVGGIGIMNIMLVSVTERTREIGVRMAVGARRWDILKQFLIEASVISLLGGGFGVALGYGLSWWLEKMTAVLEPQTTPGIVVYALAMATLTGILSGIYPAFKASRLDPVEALRYE